MRILIAVDGSRYSLDAVKLLIEHCGALREPPQVEVVTVHLPVPAVGRFGVGVSKAQLARYYQEEGERALSAAKRALKAAKVAFEASVLVGPVAQTIVRRAQSRPCDLICIGNRGVGAVAGAFMGSTASKVLQLSDVPVLLVK